MTNKIYDVAVIGAGITGACIARELSRTNACVALIEKENDVACGSSKANSGIIHAGYDPVPGSLMAQFNIRGAALYPELAEKLHFDYKRIGSLVIAFDGTGRNTIEALFERGRKNGVEELRIIEAAELHAMEPNLSENAVAALYAPTAAVVSPYKATWAVAESAVINGVNLFCNTMVHAIEKAGGLFILRTGKGIISARFVVNAAGIAAGKVSVLAGGRRFVIKQRRGEYCLFDQKCGTLVNHVLFQTPTELGKGVLVTQTVDGNVLIGPSADDQNAVDDEYKGTTIESQSLILQKASLTIPELPSGFIINSFAGIRALAYTADAAGNPDKPLNDFIIEEDESVHGFFNAAGICSPGFSSAPAIAEYMVKLLAAEGLDIGRRPGFIEERPEIPVFSTADTKTKYALIKKNPLYGRIICRCGMVTEAEIVQAINSPLGARDIDGIKRRTRAGMGRCQGGFCSPRVTEILSREMHIPMESVTKKGGASYILQGKTRDFPEDDR
jgi:glycerol-3-phosphate dehydrogenase